MTKCPKNPEHPAFDELQYRNGCPRCPRIDEAAPGSSRPKEAPPVSAPPSPSPRRPTIYRWAEGAGGVKGQDIGQRANDPVVGWLVAVAGVLKGADFRIYHGNNSLGRGLSNRICVDDPEISTKSHTNILYAQLTNTYHISPSPPDVKSLVFVRPPGDNTDWRLVENTQRLEPFWVIKIGGSDFIFVPFCNGDFLWSV